MTTRPWSVLLGDYENTHAMRSGAVTRPQLPLTFADVPVPNRAFKRVVRDLEFDVAELALMTFLMARSRGVPLVLLPVALFARNPLTRLVCRSDRPVAPGDLVGRRIGVRSYTTTTAVWARALLADELGVDSKQMAWHTCEDGHVAGTIDPPHAQRLEDGADLIAMLRAGTLDAVLVEPVPTALDIAPVVADADVLWRRWRTRTHAHTINHVVVVRESLARDPQAMGTLIDMFLDARDRGDATFDRTGCPTGFEALRPSLDAAIAAAAAEGLLAQPLTPDMLTTDFSARSDDRRTTGLP